MKQFISLLALVIATSVFAAEEKKVCVDKMGKDGKPVMDKNGKLRFFPIMFTVIKEQ